MKNPNKRITAMLPILLVWMFLLPGNASALDQLVSSDEYSRTYMNTDLSQSIEYYPYPMFTWNEGTQKWERNQNVEVASGSISYVTESSPSMNFSSSYEIKAGKDLSGNYETFIKFGKSLPSLKGGLLIGAQLRLHEWGNNSDCYYCDSYYQNQQYSIHKITGPWDSSNLTWANKPAVSSVPAATKTPTMATTSGNFTWDISNLVSDWYKNPLEEHGLAIKAANQQDNESLRTFDKLPTDINKMPVLHVNYSPKPNAPTAFGSGLQQNSGQGYVNLSWNSVKGAKGYRVYMYNGKAFEQVYEGAGTSWSSVGKNIWPSKEQILSGDLSLKRNGTGTELADKPGMVYHLNGDDTKADDTYYFRISAFNEYGETDLSDIRSVKMPNTSPPPVPNHVRAESESISNFSLNWDSVDGFDGIKYNYKLTSLGGQLIYSGTTETNSVKIPENYLNLGSDYQFSVKSVYEGGYSDFSPPLQVTAREKFDSTILSYSFPNGPFEAGMSPFVKIKIKNMGTETWTKAAGYTLKSDIFSIELEETDVIRSGETKEFAFRLPNDMPLATTTIKWRMYNQNNGYFGESLTKDVTFQDTIAPTISIVSPNDSKIIVGKVSLEGAITDYQLSNYLIAYESSSFPGNWHTITSGTEPSAKLGEWDATGLENGTYKLRFIAKDTTGNETIKDHTVYLRNPIPAPEVNEITDQSTLVSGKAKAGTEIMMTHNGIKIGSGTVGSDGNFEIPISKQMAGSQILISTSDAFIESKVVDVIVKDITPPAKPVVEAVTNKSAAVKGKTEPNAKVTVKVGGVTFTEAADEAGKFSVAIPVQNSGTAIYITVKDTAELQSGELKVVTTRMAPNMPSVNSVNNKSTTVTGTTEKYAFVYIAANGKSYSGKADSYGKFKVGIPVLNTGDKVNVYVKDGSGKISATRTVSVSRVAPNMPAVNIINNKSSEVTGKTEKSITVYAVVGGKTYSSKSDTYGNFKVTIPVQNSGVKVSIYAKDAAGKISATRSVSVSRVAPNIPVVNTVKYYSTSVSGKTEKYATVSVKIGTRTYSAKANSYGNFKVYIPKQKAGTSLYVTAKDSKGAVSAVRKVKVY